MAEELSGPRVRFAAAADDLVRWLEGLDDTAWSTVCAAEGWTVGLMSYHIALGFYRHAAYLDAALVGGAPQRFSWDETNELNARVAKEGPPDRQRVIDALGSGVGAILLQLARLRAEDYDRPIIVYDEQPHSLDWFVRHFVLGHLRGHAASMRAAVGTALR